MAARVVFTDPSTGRIVSAADAGELDRTIRSVYDNGLQERQILSFGSVVEDLTQDVAPNWTTEPSKWGEKWAADEGIMSLSALLGTEAPEGAISFQVRYAIAANPDYPQGFMSSDFLGIEQWPPDLSAAGDRGAVGVDSVFFRVRQGNA